jgi:hypothetical protein
MRAAVGPSLLPLHLASGGVGLRLRFRQARVVSDGCGGNRLCLMCGSLLAVVDSWRPCVQRGPAVCSCAVGSYGELDVRAPRGSRSCGLLRRPLVRWAPVAGSSAVGSCSEFECGGLLRRDLWSYTSRPGGELDRGLSSAKTSSAVGSAGTRHPCGGLVRGELHGGLGGDLGLAEASCTVSSRRAHAR